MGIAKDLEVLRNAGHRHIGLARQGFDMSGRLREEVEQLQAPVARQRMADPGKEGIETLLERSV